jgi:hypothetical protein
MATSARRLLLHPGRWCQRRPKCHMCPTFSSMIRLCNGIPLRERPRKQSKRDLGMTKASLTQTMGTLRSIRLRVRQRPETESRPDTPQRLLSRVPPRACSQGPRTTRRHRLPTSLALHHQTPTQLIPHGDLCSGASTPPFSRERHHLLTHHPRPRRLISNASAVTGLSLTPGM